MPSSPVINAGNNELIPPGTDLDEAGNPRVVGGVVDMGAVKSQLLDCPSFPHTVAAGDTADLIFSIACANSTPDDDVIELTNSTYTLTAVNNNDAVGGNGLPTIVNAGTLTIHGNGAIIQRSTAGGTPEFRLFYISANANLTLTQMRLVWGSVTTHSGGAIFNRGALLLDSVQVANNAAAEGGALTVAGGSTTVLNSELSNNVVAGYGAAVFMSAGTLNLINSTVSANTVTTSGSDNGGALDIYYLGSPNPPTVVSIINSSITNNTAADASRSGLWLEASTSVTIQNSIVAGNNGANNCFISGGSLIDGGKNIDNGSSCGFGGSLGHNTNPMLGGLAYNGGFTQTHALLSGSPAVDAGDTAKAVDQHGDLLTTDQRGSGYPRVAGSSVDIGAFEATVCFALTTTVSPGGSGSVAVDPPDNCSGSGYIPGTVVQLSATAGADYSFDHWSGDAIGTSNPTTVTMNGVRTVTANFTAPTVLTVGNSFQDNGGHIAYTGTWGTSSGGSYSGGTMHFTGQSGATLSFPLSGAAGNRLTILRSTGPDRGNMQVCIGTGVCQSFSNYSLIPLTQQPLTILLPNDGSFIITITNQGTSGQYLDFDAVSLLASPAALTVGSSFQDDSSAISYSGQWISNATPATTAGRRTTPASPTTATPS